MKKLNKSLLSLVAVVGLLGSIASLDACCGRRVVRPCCGPVATAVRVVEPVVQTAVRVVEPAVQVAQDVVEVVTEPLVQSSCPIC